MAKIWTIREPDKIDRILNRLGPVERKQYYRLIQDFLTCDNPAKFGKLEIIKGNRVWVARLNISYRVVYHFSIQYKRIVIVAVGDHNKETGLKE